MLVKLRLPQLRLVVLLQGISDERLDEGAMVVLITQHGIHGIHGIGAGVRLRRSTS